MIWGYYTHTHTLKRQIDSTIHLCLWNLAEVLIQSGIQELKDIIIDIYTSEQFKGLAQGQAV